MAIAQINNGDLFYTIEGSENSEWLLLIAGFSSDSSAWNLMVPLLAQQYRVVCFDNRGIGQSSPLTGPYSIPQMAADALALLDYLHIETVHLVGHSMGGQIAQALAIAHPERVSRLVLLATWADRDPKFNAWIRLFGELAEQLNPRQYQHTILPWVFSARFYATPGAIDQVYQWIDTHSFPVAAETLHHQSQAMLNHSTGDRLPKIQCPTLVIAAAEDIVTPPYFLQTLAAGIPNAKLIIIEQVGHSLVIEAADIAAEHILAFL